MYDFPHLAAAHDLLWQHIAERVDQAGFGPAPDHLSRNLDLAETWLAPNLLLGQTCGYPLVTLLREQVQVVCTPKYRAAGCSGAFHRSLIVTRDDNEAVSLSFLKGRTAAVNSIDSNSGFNAFRSLIAPLAGGVNFFENVILTTSHAKSIDAVLDRKADVAAIDCVTFSILRDLEPEKMTRLKVLRETETFPSLPYITSRYTGSELVALLRQTLLEIDQFPALDGARAALLLDGFEVLQTNAYDSILALERHAQELKYPKLA